MRSFFEQVLPKNGLQKKKRRLRNTGSLAQVRVTAKWETQACLLPKPVLRSLGTSPSSMLSSQCCGFLIWKTRYYSGSPKRLSQDNDCGCRCPGTTLEDRGQATPTTPSQCWGQSIALEEMGTLLLCPSYPRGLSDTSQQPEKDFTWRANSFKTIFGTLPVVLKLRTT